MAINCIVCHYDEIGLKGKNRNFFENKLRHNIEQKFSSIKVKKLYGRFVIELKNYSNDELRVLSNTFGLANFSLACKTELNIDSIIEASIILLQDKNFSDFRVTTIRSDKNFSLTSQQVNQQVGAAIVKKLNKKVKLKNPVLTCYIEIVDKQAYIYTDKIQGLGGLPVGVSGRAICLLSGGIDSPVAAYYGMKRGLRVDFLHFHSYPQTTKESINKVKQLAQQLKQYSLNSKLYLCPFIDIQKQLYTQIPEKLRIIFYRRFMFRIAAELAKKQRAQALITGESLGQVASQTIENITAIEEVAELPVIRPLICFDKKEIISKAQEINTYNISIAPHDDCCVVFMPKNPETKAKKSEIHKIESQLDVKKLIDNVKLSLDKS